MRWDKNMRATLFALFLTAACGTSAMAQDTTRPNGAWNVVNGVDSADLAVLGWTLVGTTALPAGSETGLLVTFWRAADGSVARCIFSLVSRTGAPTFETCSLAQVVKEDTQ